MKPEKPLTEEEFARLSEPALRLFLSVDLENSTRLKQSAGGAISDWMREVLLFTRNFPVRFEAEIQRAGKRAPRAVPYPMPPVWKTLGDELIFVEAIRDRNHLVQLIACFTDALRAWNDDVRQSSGKGTLLVKGTAWVAGFPVVNATVKMGDGTNDYIGPSVDAGFRLGRFSKPRQITISVDLAWLLIRCEAPLLVRFDGPAVVKGVAEETGYPILWLEVGRSLYVRKQAEMLGRDREVAASDMQELCEHFIREFGVPNHLPFIPNEPDLTPVPADYLDQLGRVERFLRSEVFVVEDAGGAGEVAPPAAQDKILQRLEEQGGGSTS